jgi:Cu(I)/Ag(I) efflux system protein CusF
MKSKIFSIMCFIALTLSSTVWGQNLSDEHHSYPNLTVMFDSPIDASGIVKSIADDNESISIHHDAIPAIRWSSMVMPFKVIDHELIHYLEIGDRIDFQFIRKDGKNIIVKVEKAKRR